MKIYVVGPVGSGKSTLAKRISKELDILYVELDSVIWNNDIKRDVLDVQKKFNKILESDNWVIEDVGRDVFSRSVVLADVVIYLKNNGFSTTDGIHYDKNTYQKIYSYINFNVK